MDLFPKNKILGPGTPWVLMLRVLDSLISRSPKYWNLETTLTVIIPLGHILVYVTTSIWLQSLLGFSQHKIAQPPVFCTLRKPTSKNMICLCPDFLLLSRFWSFQCRKAWFYYPQNFQCSEILNDHEYLRSPQPILFLSDFGFLRFELSRGKVLPVKDLWIYRYLKYRYPRSPATCPPCSFRVFEVLCFGTSRPLWHLSSVLSNNWYPKSRWTPRSHQRVLHRWMLLIISGLCQ
jgi:hypothetical protein